ncbi:MAG TPA: DUF3341 domain-containing protein [Fimbriiglobus sp.]
MTPDETPVAWGLLAEFETADRLIEATKAAKAAGYNRMDGYSPYPIPEVADALNFPRSEIGAIMFIGGMCGAIFGLYMETFATAIDYPIVIGGKPYFSLPMYVPIMWELLVLTASLTGTIGLFALCGLPQPYHPLFNVPQFDRASRDRFFLAIEAVDPQYDAVKTRVFLETLTPASIAEVPE